MDELFAGLLLSCPNDGGLFYLNGRQAIKLDGLDTTGIDQTDGRVLRGLQPDRIYVLDNPACAHEMREISVPDIHDVLLGDDVHYAVGTQGNEVVKLDRDGNELQRFAFPGESDSWHVNCLVRLGERVLFSAFGDYREHRAYKAEPIGSGFVQDLYTGERLIAGLSQPHSMVKVGFNLLLANSYEGEIHEYDAAFQLLRKRNLGGYTRGILVDGDRIYVGLSASRNRDDEVACATLLALDASSWNELGRLPLPVNEVYGILKPKVKDLPTVLAANASLASHVLASRCEERERSLNEAALRLKDQEREHQALEHRVSEHQTVLEDLAKQLQDKSTFADELVHQLSQNQDELRRCEEQLQAKSAFTDEVIRQMDLKQVELGEREEQLYDQLRAKDAQMDELCEQLNQMRTVLQQQEDLSKVDAEQMGAKDARINELDHQVNGLRSTLADCEAQQKRLQESLSWRITAPLRSCNAFRRHLVAVPRRVAAAIKHVFQDTSSRQKYAVIARQLGPFGALRHALRFLRRGGPSPEPGSLPSHHVFDLRNTGGKPVAVLSTMHCRYVAELIVSALERAGIAARIIYEAPSGDYDSVPHFVICPQMFERLPGLFVSFQMEQSVSTRWFTPDYLRKLENSFAIFDYSLDNISRLVSMGLQAKQFYYLPIGYLSGYEPNTSHIEKEYDVLFYGDINNDRRRACIIELEKVCKVKVISNLFGKAVTDELRRARIVVNIHYYPGALLESTRLWECISLGCLVVSERSSDMDQHEELLSLVDFVDEDDFVGMAARIRHWLDDESAERKRVVDIATRVASMFNRFDYFFYRFLLASGNLSFEDFWQLIGSTYPLPSDKLCLNLPEYTDRAVSFDKDNHYGFHRFPGLRHSKGWIGCALSYKYMIRLAMARRMPQISICEDDVEFPGDFDITWSKISLYLSSTVKQWHIFSGLIADLHEDAKILKVDQHAGYEFVTTDKMTSTVFNVYDQASYEVIADWDEADEDAVTNTIDRYLENNKSLRVLTTCPFLVGHKEDLYSTLWGGQNTVYKSYISKSEALMRQKVEAWYSKKNRWHTRLPVQSDGVAK